MAGKSQRQWGHPTDIKSELCPVARVSIVIWVRAALHGSQD